jgi:hypothetical protein
MQSGERQADRSPVRWTERRVEKAISGRHAVRESIRLAARDPMELGQRVRIEDEKDFREDPDAAERSTDNSKQKIDGEAAFLPPPRPEQDPTECNVRRSKSTPYDTARHPLEKCATGSLGECLRHW